jgi:hypothetical protein
MLRYPIGIEKKWPPPPPQTSLVLKAVSTVDSAVSLGLTKSCEIVLLRTLLFF